MILAQLKSLYLFREGFNKNKNKMLEFSNTGGWGVIQKITKKYRKVFSYESLLLYIITSPWYSGLT